MHSITQIAEKLYSKSNSSKLSLVIDYCFVFYFIKFVKLRIKIIFIIIYFKHKNDLI